ncbi:MAG: ABC transporter ATP-binding protein [Alistipes sp.]|nr:ABC transporter ATP-binding protein [Alistipes sp.]
MLRKIKNIIPQEFHTRAFVVAITVLLRAILNFFGIAMLVPLLMLILDFEALQSNHIVRYVYDFLGCKSHSQFVIATALAIVGFIALKNMMNLWLYKYERNFTYDLYGNLSRRLFVDYYRRGLLFVSERNSTELSRNVNIVCLNFVIGVLKPAAAIVGEIIPFALIIVAIIFYDPTASLLLALTFVPAVWIYYSFVKERLLKYGAEENQAQREKFRNVAESFRGYTDVEISNAFPQIISSFNRATDRLVAMRKRDATLSNIPQGITETSLAAGMAALIIIGAFMPERKIGLVFGLFAVAAVRLLPSIRNILTSLTAIRYNLHTIDTLSDISNDKMEIDNSSERIHLHQQMEVRNISFRYTKNAQSVIEDFSLTIKQGERIGLRGASGAGKSTLMNLLLGLYAPDKGEILIDGIKLDQTTRRKWQNSVGYVPQSVFLLDSTLLENIALGVPSEEIDRKRVMEVLKMASLTEFVERLPDGLDSSIGEAGCRVSGGERQRIGIARALYKRPDILFFDEATSSLDRTTEQSINSSIEELSRNNRNITIVAIAHRETSLEYCDRIINIEKL